MRITPAAHATTKPIPQTAHEHFTDFESLYSPITLDLYDPDPLIYPSHDIPFDHSPLSHSQIPTILHSALDSPSASSIESSALALSQIVASAPPHRWHETYLEVLTVLLSAAWAVGGEAAGRTLARLVAALARRGEVVGAAGGRDLGFETGGFWVRGTCREIMMGLVVGM